jgi:hypothetical protein
MPLIAARTYLTVFTAEPEPVAKNEPGTQSTVGSFVAIMLITAPTRLFDI